MNKNKVDNGVQEIVLDSWTEFVDLSSTVFAKAPAFIYRGQAKFDWRLCSTIDRLQERYPKRKNLVGGAPEYFDRPPFTHEEHLAAFKRAVRGRLGPQPSAMTDDEYWALGQHHGLATSLLDWTRSPFAALFFAFEKEKITVDGCEVVPEHRGVYAISTATLADCKSDAPVHIVSPSGDTNYRLISQGGLLLKLPEQADLESYVRKNLADLHDASLIRVKIPNTDRDGCLVALNKMNINHMTLFPDIDGAAKYVNSLWQPGHEDSLAYV